MQRVSGTLKLGTLARAWDLVVVGAGPAGATAACRAASLGINTLLVDRAVFPRSKVCGGCISPAGMRALAELGLEQIVSQAGVPIHALEFHAKGRSARVMLGTGGIAIGRESLDMMLVQAVRAKGVEVLEGTSARLLHSDDRDTSLSLTSGEETIQIRAGVVISADGLAGAFLMNDQAWKPRVSRWSRIGLGTRICPSDTKHPMILEPGVVAMHCGRGGYVGMVRLAEGSIDVAAAVSPSLVRRVGGANVAVEALMRESGVAEPVFGDDIRWHGTPKLTRHRLVARGSVLVAGDAARYVEPFTGEGISWAMRGGIAAADHAEACLTLSAHAGDWQRRYLQMFAGRQRGCGVLALGCRSPRLIAGAAFVLDALPLCSSIARGLFAGPWKTERHAEGLM